MVKRIKVTKKDKLSLERLKIFRDVSESYQPENYKNKVVEKPWGYEFLIFENEHVAIWFLHINYGHSTSMHCHPEKKTSLILLTGSALCNTFERRNYLNSMDAIILEKAVFHSTKALSNEGINVIEIETPPNKTDLVRLNDEYGRESSGYEGLTQMRTENLEEFNHFFFETPEQGECFTHTKPQYEVSIRDSTIEENSLPPNSFEDNAFYSLCRGQIVSSDGQLVLNLGDTEQGINLNSKDNLISLKSALFLEINPK